VYAQQVPEIATVLSQEVPDHKLDQGLPRTFFGIIAGAMLLVIFILIFSIFAPRKEAPAMAFSAGLKGSQKTIVYGGKNEGPQFSADGKKLVFMSERGNGKNLWISNADGSNARQLTSIGDTGTPRWSPDGRTIAFDSHVRKFSAILLIDVDGGTPRLAVVGDASNSVPSWSHDGKSIYFASDRTGRYEVWKLDLGSGKQEQITKDGGFAPLEAADGKTIYYAKTQFENPGVWSVPAAGGDETLVSASIRPGTWANWSLADGEIYFVEEGPGNVAMLSSFDLKTQRMRQLTMLGRFPFWLAVDKDGSRAAFDRADSEDATSIVELEDFR
jgi:Tol biopolymer transport system component